MKVYLFFHFTAAPNAIINKGSFSTMPKGPAAATASSSPVEAAARVAASRAFLPSSCSASCCSPSCSSAACRVATAVAAAACPRVHTAARGHDNSGDTFELGSGSTRQQAAGRARQRGEGKGLKNLSHVQHQQQHTSAWVAQMLLNARDPHGPLRASIPIPIGDQPPPVLTGCSRHPFHNQSAPNDENVVASGIPAAPVNTTGLPGHALFLGPCAHLCPGARPHVPVALQGVRGAVRGGHQRRVGRRWRAPAAAGPEECERGQLSSRWL